MKISNASKKVLASALSAAMVVAFAPTVAFGAADSATADGTKTVAVTFNANGGTVTAGCAGFTTELLKDADGKYFVKVSGTNTATDASYGASTGWFVDADGDGLYNSKTEKKVTEVSGNNYVEVAADTTAVELKAIYAMPTVSFADNAFVAGGVNYAPTGGVVSDNDAASLTVKTGTEGKAGHTYVLTVKNPNGDAVGSKTFGANTAAGEAAVADLVNDQTVTFTSNPLTGDTMAAWKDKLVSGEYTVSLTDNGKEISIAKVSLAKITVKVGDSTNSKLFQLKDGKNSTVKLEDINAKTTGYVAYLDADGYSMGDGSAAITVTGDATFTATKVAQAVSTVAYTATAGDHGTIGFTLAAGAAKYAVSISDKDGVIYTGTYKTSGSHTVSFDGTIGAAHTNAVEKAGSYVVTVVATDSDDNETTSKAKMDLTEVKYAVGEGVKFNDNSDAASGDKTNWTKAAFQTAYTSDVAPTPTAIDTVTSAKDGYTPATAWQLNGKAYDAKENKLKVGESNTLTAVATAKTLAAAPGYTVEKSTAGTTTQYVLTVTPAANTQVKVEEGANTLATIATAKAFIIDGTNDITLTASSTALGVGNKVVTLKTANGLVKIWNTATASGSSKLELLEGNTGAKWSAAAGVKAAIESGKAAYEALAAKYYVSAEEITAVDLAANKALYEAILAEANAQIASYKDGANVVAGTKVWNMTAANYKDAVEKLAGEEKKLAKELKDATEAAQAIAYNKYALGTASLITTANTLLSKVTENKAIKAADVTAAQKVTEQLKAAKTAEEAKAAIEAYGQLSNEAKALVATADVAAAQQIVNDAETAQKLKDSQDLAAARDLNGKKVTAKAKVGKKAQGKSFTYKLAASESGETAVYKKVSGSKHVKISKSGKVTFSKVKVQKKAKTYSAKVSVTYGTQTVTKTVKLVVKKK